MVTKKTVYDAFNSAIDIANEFLTERLSKYGLDGIELDTNELFDDEFVYVNKVEVEANEFDVIQSIRYNSWVGIEVKFVGGTEWESIMRYRDLVNWGFLVDEVEDLTE